MIDDYDLHRFLAAQDPVYEDALDILRRGMMCTPYVDFIFPHFVHGGEYANIYALSSLDEARAYLAFPTLGNRYRECLDALSWLADRSVHEVFSETDTRKLQSSLTLFSEATNELLPRTMLDLWFDSRVDEDTIARLDRAG